ncbi:MAG: class I SAM-dependent methyltransferase [Pseudomonadota bacterium]
MTAADTFERSCTHWSESGRTEMERFYEIASVDYRHLAEARDWRLWLSQKVDAIGGGRPLRILDVACGSGKFPVALNQYASVGDGTLASIDYALLDPSRFSIDEARAALAPPFSPADEFETTLQGLECPRGAFDIVWATHALYALPASEMEFGIRRLVDACAKEAFIAHAYTDAHYLKFQRIFLDAFNRTDETRYAAAEDVIEALKTIGVSFDVSEVIYENGAPGDARDIVQGYLQRCLFDDTITLDALEAVEGTRDYLANCRTQGAWRFKQRVALISIFP